MATDHSFSFLGYRQATDLAFKPQRWGFHEREIHQRHMRRLYWRIFLLIQFQKLAIDEIGTDLPGPDDFEAISKVRKRWIELRNDRWFSRVSTQLQGNEIYRLLQQQHKLSSEVSLVGEKLSELEAAVALAENVQREKARVIEAERLGRETAIRDDAERRLARRDTLIQTLGVPAAVFVFFRAALEAGEGLNSTSAQSLFGQFVEAAPFASPLSALLALSFFASFIIAILGLWFIGLLRTGHPDEDKNRRSFHMKMVGLSLVLALSVSLLAWLQPL